MQIRERGDVVRLIRTTYDEAAKAPKSEVLAKLKRPDLDLTDDERSKLTSEELEQFETFRRGAVRNINIEQSYAAYRLPETLELVTAWLSTVPRQEALDFGLRVQKPLRTLRRQLDSLKNTGDRPVAERFFKKGTDDGDDE